MTTMHVQTDSRQTIDLGDGKTMRWSTAADTDNLAKLLSESFRWMPAGDPMPPLEIPGPNAFFASATRLMMSGKSSAMSEYDFALVEDKARFGQEGLNPIVACVALHRFKAYYGSVDMYFGKPELIATDPGYRNQGLIRKLLVEMIHPESEAHGDALQVIPGIPYFYRQFGYEYSLCSYSAFTVESTSLTPLAADPKIEPFTLHRATLKDIPLLMRLSTPANRHANAMIGQHYTQEYWQYTVHDVLELKNHRFDADRETSIIVDTATGAEIGFTVMSTRFLGPTLLAMGLEEGQEYTQELTHSVLRQLVQWSRDRLAEDAKNSAEAMKVLQGDEKEEDADAKEEPSVTEDLTKAVAAAEIKEQVKEKIEENDSAKEATDACASSPAAPEATAPEKEPAFPLELALHDQHPLILQLGTAATRPTKLQNPGMRLYTRIASYPKFLLSVASELESRSASSKTFADLTGLVRLDFFRPAEKKGGARGLELVFKDGRLISAQDWERPGPEGGLKERKQWKASGEMPRIFFASFPPMVFSSLVTGHQDLDDLYMMYGDVQLRNEESRELLKVLFPKGDHHFDLFCW